MWNDRRSCCTPTMEAAQQDAFDRHEEKFNSQIALLRLYLDHLNSIRASAVYSHADALEQALLDSATSAFVPALDLSDECAKALLVFAAGLICFGCDPHWSDYVWRKDSGSVYAVDISGDACIYVDQRCGPFGRAVSAVSNRIMDSRLAKLPAMSLPDFSMFRDRESLCLWLRTSFALHPIPPPYGSLVQMAALDPKVEGRRLDAFEEGYSVVSGLSPAVKPSSTTPAPTAPPYDTQPKFPLDPIKIGKLSGFVFPAISSAADLSAALQTS